MENFWGKIITEIVITKLWRKNQCFLVSLDKYSVAFNVIPSSKSLLGICGWTCQRFQSNSGGMVTLYFHYFTNNLI